MLYLPTMTALLLRLTKGPTRWAPTLQWAVSKVARAFICCVERAICEAATMRVVCATTRRQATDTDTTDEILAAALEHAKSMRYCAKVSARGPAADAMPCMGAPPNPLSCT
eukprot:581331-Pelagomonas_calceolata.AAC.9